MSKKSEDNKEKLDIEITNGPVESATDEIIIEEKADSPEKSKSSEVDKKEKTEKVGKKSGEFNKAKPPKDLKKKGKSKKKTVLIILIIVALLAAAGTAVYFIFFHNKKTEEPVAEQPAAPEPPHYYSKLTGLEIASESENLLPTYCMQVPNGLDGARPQAGIDEAGVIFEAIAEAGITRFAAIFQNPKSATLGPIRSLRSYYLDWDTPFDCTIVHAGGSPSALADLRAGNYRDLSEDYSYEWRDNVTYWAPNNLMTSPKLLGEWATTTGYTSSNPVTFPRLLPKDAAEAVKTARKNAGLDQDENTSTNNCEDENNKETCESTPVTPLVTKITVNFGYVSTFNTEYAYDENTNTYLRSYASGEPHLVYSCVGVEKDMPSPKADCGLAKQLAPSAVVAMMVDEYLDSDAYHHVINTIGTGIAYIFQNGTAIKGTWQKDNRGSQIIFRDADGNAISFTPGQLWVAAVPNSSGSVQY
ncbi:DUF3048 domain-containing protein [Candidatus Saccharibacteria bacterium]|nr:DUF3048 domain-containing protein [Candidatus Saccharibacteria bacterium]